MYKAIKMSEIPRQVRESINAAAAELLDFMETGYQAAEIVVPANRTSKTIYQSYQRTVKRLGLPIKVSHRAGKVYMWKEGKK